MYSFLDPKSPHLNECYSWANKLLKTAVQLLYIVLLMGPIEAVIKDIEG